MHIITFSESQNAKVIKAAIKYEKFIFYLVDLTSPQRRGSFCGKLKLPKEIPASGFEITSIGDRFFDDILQSEFLVIKPFQVEPLKMALKSRRLITAQCALVDGKEQGYIMLMEGDDGKMILSSFQARDYKTAEVLFYKVASEHVPQEAVLTVWFDHACNKDNLVSLYSKFGLKEKEEYYQGMFIGEYEEVDCSLVYAMFDPMTSNF